MSFLARIFGARSGRERLQPLYRAVVETGRDPAWYRDGKVPDTLQGRFDLIAALLALVLLRLEREEERTKAEIVLLTETFIDDMEGSVRQIGIGDVMVGKHVGRMMSALGGRLAAFRAVEAGERTMEELVRTNIFHDSTPSPDAVVFVAEQMDRFRQGLQEIELGRLLSGEVPTP